MTRIDCRRNCGASRSASVVSDDGEHVFRCLRCGDPGYVELWAEPTERLFAVGALGVVPGVKSVSLWIEPDGEPIPLGFERVAFDALAAAYGERVEAEDEVTVTSADLQSLYRERAHLVAHLTHLYPSVLSWADINEPDWAVLYVDTPAGQLSWHISPSDMDLFEHVPHVPPVDPRAQWDRHTTEEKYERLRRLHNATGTV